MIRHYNRDKELYIYMNLHTSMLMLETGMTDRYVSHDDYRV